MACDTPAGPAKRAVFGRCPARIGWKALHPSDLSQASTASAGVNRSADMTDRLTFLRGGQHQRESSIGICQTINIFCVSQMLYNNLAYVNNE